MRTILLILVFFAMMSASADVLQTAHSTPWITNVTVGVRGGVDAHRLQFTNTVMVFTNTQEHVQAVIDSVPTNTIVVLSNGTYFGFWSINRNHIILRGQSRDGVFLVCTNANNGILASGGSAAGYGDHIAVHTGFTKGSTNVTIASASWASPGDIAVITMLNPVHPTWHVISVAGYERLADQRVVVNTVVNGTNLTFSPPLITDFTNSPTMFSVGQASLNPIFASKHRIGVENLTISQTNRANGMKGSGVNMLSVGNAVDCWVTGVRVEWTKNYGFGMADVVHFYYGSNEVRDSQNDAPSSNNAGMLVASVCGGLFENSVFANRLFPAIEFNTGFNGNALFGNFFTNNFLDVDCHNSHSMMNLWEANKFRATFLMDGYFGSASHQILWRNEIRSGFVDVSFKRWTTYMHLVGNVLGVPGYSYLAYSHDTNAVGYQILELGRPNIGNGSYFGTNPPTAWNFPQTYFEYGTLTNGWRITNSQGPTNVLWGNFVGVPAPVATIYALTFQDASNTNRYYNTTNNAGGLASLASGTSSNLQLSAYVTVGSNDTLYVAGQTAYQQLQVADRATHIILENHDYYNNGVAAGFTTNATVETSILYPGGAPSWWGTNRWPAHDIDSTPLAAASPAFNDFYGISNFGSGFTPAAITIRSGGSVRSGGNTR